MWPSELIKADIIINVLVLIGDKTGREILDGDFRKKLPSVDRTWTYKRRAYLTHVTPFSWVLLGPQDGGSVLLFFLRNVRIDV
jgi:hypothetical protein